MNLMIRLFAVTSAFGWSGLVSASCNDFSEQRLNSVRQALTEIGATLSMARGDMPAASGVAVPPLGELLAEDGDGTMTAICELLSRYPSLETLLTDSARELDQSGVSQWLGEVSALDPQLQGASLPCLTHDQFIGLRTATLGVETAVAVLNGFCGAALCSPAGACIVACSIAAGAEYALPPLNYLAFQDLAFCEANHFNAMDEWCASDLGCDSSRGPSDTTLTEIQRDVRDNLLPSLTSSTDQVAVQDDLRETAEAFDDRLALSQTRANAIQNSLAVGESARGGFRDRLDRLDIESRLAADVESVDLRLPEQFGGRLVAVREVVSLAINDYQAAGITTGQALDLFRAGDDAFNLGDYSTAFSAYRDAYQELIR